MTRRDKYRKDIVADINITPFTDVVLVLLIIFMLAAPVIMGANLKVNLPKALTSKPDEAKFLIVSIDASENLYFRDRLISLDALSGIIRESASKGASVVLKINGDKRIKYRTVVRVISAARDAGVVRYLFVTERGNAHAGG